MHAKKSRSALSAILWRRMASRGSEHRAWDDDRVARELEAWFARRAFERWPTYRTFVRDGHKVLYSAVIDRGGAERWALELGVAYIPHRSGGGLTVDETHAALRQLLREHHPERFPTLAWLKRHGRPGLAAAVDRTGGGAHWAAVLNMPPPPPARWTDELIEAELRRICRDATRWAQSRRLPSRRRHRAVGGHLRRIRQPLVGTTARALDSGIARASPRRSPYVSVSPP
ncbi:MAG: hypothetical protein Q8K79_07635 [Solirubrobacteraceae bacterium]|nr:hypothetical protein [Solirubrobacteraceae bacterium]